MNIFLTGGTGFIGSHVLALLLKKEVEITLLTRHRTKASNFNYNKNLKVVKGDLRDLSINELVTHLLGIETLIHMAVIWGEAESEYEAPDAVATVKLCRAAAIANVNKIVYLSSTAVHRPFYAGMKESSLIKPCDVYGATKAAGELFVRAICQESNIRFNILRLGPVVGGALFPNCSFKANNQILRIIELALTGEDINLNADEGRQFIGVGDAANLVLKCLNIKHTDYEVICLSTELTTWHRIAELVVSILRSNSRIIVRPMPNSATAYFINERMKRLFGDLSCEIEIELKAHIKYIISSNIFSLNN